MDTPEPTQPARHPNRTPSARRRPQRPARPTDDDEWQRTARASGATNGTRCAARTPRGGPGLHRAGKYYTITELNEAKPKDMLAIAKEFSVTDITPATEQAGADFGSSRRRRSAGPRLPRRACSRSTRRLRIPRAASLLPAMTTSTSRSPGAALRPPHRRLRHRHGPRPERQREVLRPPAGRSGQRPRPEVAKRRPTSRT